MSPFSECSAARYCFSGSIVISSGAPQLVIGRPPVAVQSRQRTSKGGTDSSNPFAEALPLFASR